MHLDAAVLEHSLVRVREHERGGQHGTRDLHDVGALDWMQHQGSRRDAGPVANDEERARVGSHQHGYVSEQQLRVQIGVGGGIRPGVHDQLDVLLRPGDHHRCVCILLEEEKFRVTLGNDIHLAPRSKARRGMTRARLRRAKGRDPSAGAGAGGFERS